MTNDFWHVCQDQSVKKEQSFQQMVLGKVVDIHIPRNKFEHLPNTIDKNFL